MAFSYSLSSAGLIITALLAGAVVPFQAVSNAALGRAFGHPLWATVTSLLVSLVVVLPVILALRAPLPSFNQVTELPLWAWLGGAAGVFYISAALMLTPRLGAMSFIVCVIAGQLITSLFIDHFGLMGLPVKEANWGRVIGILLIVAGVVLVQWFTDSPGLEPDASPGLAQPPQPDLER